MTVPALSEWRTACSVERRGAFLTTGNARKKGEIRAMRKNKMMRAASGLLVAVLLSTCAISGTFAKYTTSTDSTDKARVAVWGFNKDAVAELDLFDSSYGTTVKAADNDNLIAPGTTKTGTFSIINNAAATKPEVSYNFTVSVAGSEIADTIKNNPNILWKLDNGTFGTWEKLMSDILSLSGTNTTYVSGTTEAVTKQYNPDEVPGAFVNGKTHTITWKWIFDENATDKETGTSNNDIGDTEMGNVAVTTDTNVVVKITVTATQID